MRIAIVKLSALGDIIHAMVALQFIKQYFPNSTVDWVVEQGFKDILNNNPDINKIHTVNIKQAKQQKSLRLLFKEFKKIRQFGQYDLVIDAQGLIKSAIVSKLIRSNRVSGFDKHSIRESIASIMYSHTTSVAYDANTIDRNAKVICNPLGIKVKSKDIAHKKAFLFSKSDIEIPNKPFAIFVVGSTWESRNYPKEKFIKVAESLQMNCLIAWGNDSEKAKATWMAEQSKFISVLPKLNLDDLKRMIQNSSLLIGNDTGPTHMAWGLNIPSITLFGPTPINRVYQTPINKVLKSSSIVDHFNLNKKDYSIAEIKVTDIVRIAKKILKENI
jgi:heptosyltransferase-1